MPGSIRRQCARVMASVAGQKPARGTACHSSRFSQDRGMPKRTSSGSTSTRSDRRSPPRWASTTATSGRGAARTRRRRLAAAPQATPAAQAFAGHSGRVKVLDVHIATAGGTVQTGVVQTTRTAAPRGHSQSRGCQRGARQSDTGAPCGAPCHRRSRRWRCAKPQAPRPRTPCRPTRPRAAGCLPATSRHVSSRRSGPPAPYTTGPEPTFASAVIGQITDPTLSLTSSRSRGARRCGNGPSTRRGW